MELGNNIKELRKQKGLRQEQLAEAMGVSTASVSKWETNQSYPELTLLAELADFFEVSIDALVTSVFQDFQAINILAEGWIALGEPEKACSALKWMYGVMDSMHYNPTTLLLILVKLAGLYKEQKQPESAKDAFRQAAQLVKENSRQEVYAEADFLQIQEAREMLTSAPEGNQALLTDLATNMGEAYAEIVKEVLQ